jgi:hypothetical protein
MGHPAGQRNGQRALQRRGERGHVEMSAVGSGADVRPMPGGGSTSANAALARKMMPAWAGGILWTDWNNVAMRESGWSAYAANPTSDARGIAQRIQGGAWL